MQVKERNYWTKEKCAEAASECNSRKEFKDKYDSGYQKAHKKGWIDEICSHMILLNSLNKRDVYAIQSTTGKSIYVGLSYNYQKRYISHCVNPAKHVISLINSEHVLILLEKSLEINEAVNKECEYIEKYKIEGWNVVNKIRCGSIGAPFARKWSFDKVKKEALKYTKRMDFYRTATGAYDYAWEKGILQEITSHMPNHIRSIKAMIQGELLTVTEIAKKFNLHRQCVLKRVKKGLSEEQIILPCKQCYK